MMQLTVNQIVSVFFCHCGYVTIDEANGLVGELIICQFVHLLKKGLFRDNTIFPCTAFFLPVVTASSIWDTRRMLITFL